MAKLAPQGPFRAFDNNGDPLDGGKLYTYVAGTTTPKDTFTTEAGDVANDNPIILDANGYADVWLGDGAYKFVLKDENDVTLWTLDDISGDVSSSFASSVVDISTNTTVNATYQNQVLRCTSGVTLSLLDVTTAGDGFAIVVRNDSGSDVTIDPDGSEQIDGSSTYTLSDGGSLTVVCNGTAWYTLFYTPITIASQAEAEAGTNNTNFMTPLRTAQALAAQLPAVGKVLQFVYAANPTGAAQTTTSATFSDVTGMSLAITPTASDSIIYGFMYASGQINSAGGELDLRVFRGATEVAFHQPYFKGTTNDYFPVNVSFVDTPATTSEITYNLEYASGSGTVGFRSSGESHRWIVLMEIGA